MVRMVRSRGIVRGRARQHGFTIVEIMIAVAIIAVLAAIAVPMWTRESRKVKADSEVTSMFGELVVKLEQYKLENGAYLAAAACPGAPAPTGYKFVDKCKTSGSEWEKLRVSPESSMSCTYEIVVGDNVTVPSPPSPFTMATPATSWFYLVATCDMDGQGAPYATFFRSSLDSSLQKADYGL